MNVKAVLLGGRSCSSTCACPYEAAAGATAATYLGPPRCLLKCGIRESTMDIGPLLVEQRRVGDEYRSTEKVLQLFRARLAALDLEAAERAKIETVVNDTRAELERLWNRMLELDAAVTASAFKSGEP